MNLAYYSEFKSRYNTPYRVEIYTKKNTGSAKEIRLSGTPFTAEWESDRLYKPLKMSNAVCSIITRELLLDLYTGENQGVEVVLRNRETNTLEWFGFVTPNMYSSDYISLDTLDIEAIDSIACLDNIKYSYMGEKADFRSFSEIICNVLAKADPQKRVQKLYVQNCNKLTSSATACILKSLYIHERNFFDEMNEPMTCKDVLTSLVEYLGMTLMQWKDAYYIIDYEYIDNGYTDCTLFNIRNLTSSNTIFPISNKNIMYIGVSSSNGSISLDSVYNKVTVVANTNAIGDLCPDLIDDDDLENQNSDPDKYYTQTIDDTVFLSAYFKSKENWETLQSVEEMDDSNIGNIYYGSFFQKTDSYSVNDSEPSSLDWGTYLTFCSKTMGGPWLTSGNKLYTPYLTLKKKNASLLNSGYLIIDFSYKFSQSYIADDGFNSPSGKSVYISNSSNKYSAGYEDTKFYCRLKIGDYYYNGEEWRLYSEYTNNLDYYKVNLGIESVYGEKKYYIHKSDGSKEYITKLEYEKIYAKDRFLIVRKNNENDKVYDTWYNPTNQVSYKENLSNSSDGVLIKLPSFCLYGEIELDLCPPTILGGRPCYLTDGTGSDYCYYCHIKDFSMKYTDRKYIYDVFGNKLDDTEDIVYSNVINDSYITEADDIELTVNSYAKQILSYSNVATKNSGKLDYLKSVYSRIAGSSYLPEQILIDKLYRHHKAPKLIYKNSLNYKLSPFDMIKENSLDKTMLVNALGIDYANDSVDVTLIEL